MALLSGTDGVGDSSRSSATVHSHRSAAGHASVRERIRSFDAASLSGEETRPAQQSCRSAPAQPRLRCLIKKWGQSRLSPISPNGRVWCMLDTLFLGKTISESRDISKRCLEEA